MQTFENIFNTYKEKIDRECQESIQQKNTLENKQKKLLETLTRLESSKSFRFNIQEKKNTLNQLTINLEKENQRFLTLEAKQLHPRLSDILEPTESIIEVKNIDFGELFFMENGIKCDNTLIVIDKHCRFTNCNIALLKFENYSYLKEEQKYDLLFDSFHNNDNLTIMIENSHFYGKFYINKKNLRENDSKERDIKIQNFHIKNSIFHQNFKLHYAIIEEFEINDSNFEDKADFFNTKFINGKNKESPISFYAINFNELAIFEECEFCEKVDFTYVTFKGLSQFRKATFKKGLNLDNTNIEKDMNFFEIKNVDSSESKKQTSQETYRIIKNQLEKQNNKIEANRYYSCELEKRREYLKLNCFKTGENFLSYIIFTLHNMTSAHSRNWVLVLLWIFNIGGFTFLYQNTSISNILITSIWMFALFISTMCFSGISSAGFILILFVSLLGFYEIPFELTKVLEYTSILNDKKDHFSLILFANKIALGYLYYQFITSVRKDTSK